VLKGLELTLTNELAVLESHDNESTKGLCHLLRLTLREVRDVIALPPELARFDDATREQIIEILVEQEGNSDIYDLSAFVEEGLYLKGYNYMTDRELLREFENFPGINDVLYAKAQADLTMFEVLSGDDRQ
jgi:hypothetical protein